MTNEFRFNILIVDDERADLHVLYHTLRHDYNVITANSGKTAIQKVRLEKPDLILLDIKLPDISGYDVLSQLKDSKETHDIPIIFITGLSSVEDETKGLILGAVDYITKPLNVNVVKARVKTHLQIIRQMRMIERLGMTDVLTDIPNRRKFNQQINIEWEKGMRNHTYLALLMIDIDHFKSYNDAFGHTMGDALLQLLSKEMLAHLERPGDLLARLGGDEFAALLPDTDLEEAVRIGEGIRADIEALNIASGIDPQKPVTVSVGVAVIIPDEEGDIDNFISICDMKLYMAKKNNKNVLYK